MSFADTFATQLGDRTGTTVDASQFPDSDTVSTDLQALQDFLNGLEDTDRSTLDIIASDGIDLSQAIDDSGATVIPGGSLLALAGTVGEPLGTWSPRHSRPSRSRWKTPAARRARSPAPGGRPVAEVGQFLRNEGLNAFSGGKEMALAGVNAIISFWNDLNPAVRWGLKFAAKKMSDADLAIDLALFIGVLVASFEIGALSPPRLSASSRRDLFAHNLTDW